MCVVCGIDVVTIVVRVLKERIRSVDLYSVHVLDVPSFFCKADFSKAVLLFIYFVFFFFFFFLVAIAKIFLYLFWTVFCFVWLLQSFFVFDCSLWL